MCVCDVYLGGEGVSNACVGEFCNKILFCFSNFRDPYNNKMLGKQDRIAVHLSIRLFSDNLIMPFLCPHTNTQTNRERERERERGIHTHTHTHTKPEQSHFLRFRFGVQSQSHFL